MQFICRKAVMVLLNKNKSFDYSNRKWLIENFSPEFVITSYYTYHNNTAIHQQVTFHNDLL